MPHGIYIHYPYCVHKCSYCDFYSLESRKSEKDFAELILREIELRCDGDKIPADTIFFGGGTPSLMSPDLLASILDKLHNHFDISSDSEITLECNPGTIDIQYFTEYKSLGINRISFGVQSFNERELHFLERIHSADDVFKAFDTARKVGFDNISLDLIFAIPGQTLETWKDTISKAISLEPNHISTYSLIYEEGTPLYRKLIKKKIKSQSEDSDIEFYNYAVEQYSKAGFELYEVSNFAKNEKYCKHNLKYWMSEEYYAFGPSAHGYVDGFRYANYRSIGKYKNHLRNSNLPEENRENVSLKEQIYERLYLELRALGLRLDKFKNDFGIDLYHISQNIIKEIESHGYGKLKGNTLKLSSVGYFIGDELTLRFMQKIDEYSENLSNF